MVGALNPFPKLLKAGARKVENDTLQPFAVTLDRNDLNMGVAATDITLSGGWDLIAYYMVSAQQRAAWGSGTKGQSNNQGYIYFKVQEAGPTDIEGKVRLVISNHQRTKQQVVWEGRTQELDGDVNDINKKVAIPLMAAYIAKEDSYLDVYLKADTAAKVIDESLTTIVVNIPATIWQ